MRRAAPAGSIVSLSLSVTEPLLLISVPLSLVPLALPRSSIQNSSPSIFIWKCRLDISPSSFKVNALARSVPAYNPAASADGDFPAAGQRQPGDWPELMVQRRILPLCLHQRVIMPLQFSSTSHTSGKDKDQPG